MNDAHQVEDDAGDELTATARHVRDHVTALVDRLAGDEGIEVTVQWQPGGVCSSLRGLRDGRDVITLGHDYLRTPALAGFFAVHELGHVVLGHTRRRRRITNVAALFAATVVIGVVALVVLPDPVFLPAGVLLPMCLVLHLIIRYRMRPAEYAADQYAAEHGRPITELGDPDGWRWWHELLPTHPSWERRQQRTAATANSTAPR